MIRTRTIRIIPTKIRMTSRTSRRTATSLR